MTPEQEERVDRLLDEAITPDRPASQRDAFVRERCADDPVVCEAVLARLASHAARTATSLSRGEAPVFSSGAPTATRREFRKGDRIGPFTLRKSLGGGGFGSVWLGERREPNMTVAIKVLHGGGADERSKARFQAEAQALAILHHEAIAKIFEADFGDAGEPYIAMEYVEGEKITAYCDRRSLSLQQRLELIARVCEAVHHAHARGIIHRDLKPDNILVTEVRCDPRSLKGREKLLQVGQEGEQAVVARPKIVDFGLAKALTPNTRLSDMTLTVDLGKLMGTLEYMAPEQTDHEPLSVDTRSDIFALGIVLYELITGTLPLPKEDLRQRAFYEAVAHVRGTPRPAPSTRFSALTAEAAATAARLRGESSPERLSRTLRGRLQHLPGTALRLEKERRYTSAAAFARDIRHYLENEPFEEAAAEPMRRKLWLAVKRKPLPYVAAALILLCLVVGIIGTTWGWGKAVEAQEAEAEQRKIAQSSERRAGEEADRANKARQAEETQRKLAEAEADRARRSDYANRILLAQQEIERSNIAQARSLLDGCPPDLRHYEWHRLRAVMDVSVATLRGHEREVLSVALSTDGRRIVSGSDDKTIKVWDTVKGGEPLLTLHGHEAGVWSVALSADGRRIVSGSWDRTIKVWDAEKGGEALVTLRGHKSVVSSVALSADSRRIVSGSFDNTIKVWDAEKGGDALFTLRGHENEKGVISVAISIDGRRIASGGGRTIKVWDAQNGGEALLALREHESVVTIVAFSTDGKRIVSGGFDKAIKVWDAEQGGEALLTLRGHEGRVRSIALSADGRRIVSGSDDKTVRLWDTERGGDALLTLRGHESWLRSVALSADGRRIVSGSDDNTIKVWDAEKGGDALLTLRGHERYVSSVALSSDGRRTVSGSSDKTIKVWDTEKGGEALLTLRGHDLKVNSVALSSDGRRIVSGSSDKTIKVWDAEKGGEALLTLRGHDLVIDPP